MDLLKTVTNENGNVACVFAGDRGYFVKARTKEDEKNSFSLLDFYFNVEEANKAAEILAENLQ
jgi:hypothetical protein